MNIDLQSTMREAMRLMKAGDLAAATDAIRHRIGDQARGDAPVAEPTQSDCFEGTFRVVDAATSSADDATGASCASATAVPAKSVQFTEHRYAGLHGARQYKLFTPSAYLGQPLPLIVMLHGCTQSPDDFAIGTRMNTLAEQHACFVVYPAQDRSANVSKCWNWFKAGDQRRGHGEPALIAGLVMELVSKYSIDQDRVYVAGMSAGGAMAVVLGSTYPDLFAAVGVHSGLAYAAAHDLPSALAAMHRARPDHDHRPSAERSQIVAPPTIIFHGDRDTTVHPCNGEQVAAESAQANMRSLYGDAPADQAAAQRMVVEDHGRMCTRTAFRSPVDEILVEHWLVHGGAHAWFGGDPQGTYTDPRGPDASAAMVRFFLERVRKADAGQTIGPARRATG